jgi:PAS domain S-box-containing protein
MPARARSDFDLDLLPTAINPATLVAEHPWSLLAAIVDSCDEAVVSKDLTGQITSWNPAASRLFGYRPDEIIGKSVLQLIPEELRHTEAEILRKIRAGQRIERYETVRVSKSGERLDVSLTISPIRDRNGRIIGASKIAHDISERKRVERLLLQSEKIAATGRMAATVAHEINNPLEAVMNLVYLARLCAEEGTEQHRYLKSAENEIERVSHIARSTLGFYRDRGTPMEAGLSELMDAVLLIYESRFHAHRITIEREYNHAQPIVVSKGEITQVFSNLIANAVDAMPRGGVLRTGIKEVGCPGATRLRVTVEDHGMGIEEANMGRIFEPFFTTKPDVGTGIGLWVTRQLLERRGGTISIASSTKPGCSGTTATVEIPLKAKPIAAQDLPDPALEIVR